MGLNSFVAFMTNFSKKLNMGWFGLIGGLVRKWLNHQNFYSNVVATRYDFATNIGPLIEAKFPKPKKTFSSFLESLQL